MGSLTTQSLSTRMLLTQYYLFPAVSRTYEATDSDSALSTYLDGHCPVNSQLEVKEGAQVMLAKNLNVEAGLVNGARGVITGFENGMYGECTSCNVCCCFLCGTMTGLQQLYHLE